MANKEWFREYRKTDKYKEWLKNYKIKNPHYCSNKSKRHYEKVIKPAKELYKAFIKRNISKENPARKDTDVSPNTYNTKL